MSHSELPVIGRSAGAASIEAQRGAASRRQGTRPLKIGLLMMGHVDPKSVHVAGDYPELFGSLLEGQGIPAVKVRSKFQIGELLLGKGQFDLALQVFEDVINKNAHSGVVLDALRYAVTCSEKLGLQSKKDQYSSMLNDVFEAK